VDPRIRVLGFPQVPPSLPPLVSWLPSPLARRLFDESLGFVDSFKPVYVFENGSPGQGYYRVALLAGLVSFIVWAARQPTEFDGFLQAQKEFVDDLYSGECLPPSLCLSALLIACLLSGNLLTDYSQSAKDTIDRNKRVPDLEDLLRQIELDEIAADVTKSSQPSSGEGDEETARACSDTDDEDCVATDGDEYLPDFEEEE
jgi:hypothetical protein